jgi:pimeloyl-ACP methyl ester carboxylesterase
MKAATIQPSGQMVDIGGRRMHARVMGSGAPTVVFESGIAASSISWTVLQPQAAGFTTTVSYDRAGLGWSDLGPGRFDADRMLSDLALLLERLRVPAPYVLVGHSYGALLARRFAERNLELIGGLVLIDPALAGEWAKPDARHRRRLRAACVLSWWGALLARCGVVRLATTPLLRESTAMPKLIARMSAGPAAGILDRLIGEIRKLPRASWPTVQAVWCRTSSFRGLIRHLRALPASFEGLRNTKFDFPVVVISASDTSAEGLAEHRTIAALSSQGEHLIADVSGHWVHFDQPELITGAIRRIATAARHSISDG